MTSVWNCKIFPVMLVPCVPRLNVEAIRCKADYRSSLFQLEEVFRVDFSWSGVGGLGARGPQLGPTRPCPFPGSSQAVHLLPPLLG